MPEISVRAKEIVDRGYAVFVDPESDLGQQIAAYRAMLNNRNLAGNKYFTADRGLDSVLGPTTKQAIKTQTLLPISANLFGTQPATAANYGTFFVADRPYEVIAITEIHGTAGTDASAVTLNIERLQNTESTGNGDDLLSSTFDLKGTANTVQYGDLVNTSLRVLARGDRLGLVDSGTLTSVADLTVTVLLKSI